MPRGSTQPPLSQPRASSQPPVSHPRGSQPQMTAPAQRSSQPSFVSSHAGLASPGATTGTTRLGVAPAPIRPSKPHPIASQSLADQPRGSSGTVWLVVGLLLILASAATLVFVLAS